MQLGDQECQTIDEARDILLVKTLGGQFDIFRNNIPEVFNRA
jgi:hypothetical protein